ncbi:hypothetical protein CEXT_148031 [Caerostris extrusa]|uniref:Uncharacterized protein n=1 Tax=Caerostris extrusa TaxID=172846 RepID=A0AAV4S551_CAEEX|nr:hypothetical protein CEXT_148031 [Caerostris extrusa]
MHVTATNELIWSKIGFILLLYVQYVKSQINTGLLITLAELTSCKPDQPMQKDPVIAMAPERLVNAKDWEKQILDVFIISSKTSIVPQFANYLQASLSQTTSCKLGQPMQNDPIIAMAPEIFFKTSIVPQFANPLQASLSQTTFCKPGQPMQKDPYIFSYFLLFTKISIHNFFKTSIVPQFANYLQASLSQTTFCKLGQPMQNDPIIAMAPEMLFIKISIHNFFKTSIVPQFANYLQASLSQTTSCKLGQPMQNDPIIAMAPEMLFIKIIHNFFKSSIVPQFTNSLQASLSQTHFANLVSLCKRIHKFFHIRCSLSKLVFIVSLKPRSYLNSRIVYKPASAKPHFANLVSLCKRIHKFFHIRCSLSKLVFIVSLKPRSYLNSRIIYKPASAKPLFCKLGQPMQKDPVIAMTLEMLVKA